MAARFDIVVADGTLVAGAGRRQADLAISGGRVVALGDRGEFGGQAQQVIDAGGLFVLPGAIDGHVHFREPGLEAKETWLTGSRAAVHGGVTTVLEMPNTLPPTRGVAEARAKLELAAVGAYCDFGIFGLVDPAAMPGLAELLDARLVVGLKVFLAPSTGDITAPSDGELLQALALARKAGLRTAFHAEDGLTIRASSGTRPIEAEVRAIDRAGGLLQRAGAAGHILHLSSADALEAVRRWRARGVDLTCEVTPHHLFLDQPTRARLGGRAKVYPPIRDAPHPAALLAALVERAVDLVASDHAPHAPEDKDAADTAAVPAGVPGVETLLPLMLEAAHSGWLSLEDVVRLTAEAPARTWNLWPAKGALQPGSDADLVLVEFGSEASIAGAALHGLHAWSPFEGRTVHGKVVTTLVRGRVVVERESLVGEPGWGTRVER
jgi:dihydroorotase